MIKYLKNNQHFILAFAVFIIYFSPNLFFQDEAQVLIHDNLDSNVVWFKNVVESPNLFGGNYDKIERALNGIERGLYMSEYRVTVWLYILFPPQTAYHLNIILLHLIGFVGMFLLLKDYIFRNAVDAKYEITLIALAFSLLPFWPSGGAGISGLPLLFYSLLNIYHSKHKLGSWSWIVLYPLYSELFLSGLFVVPALAIYFLYRMVTEKKIVISVFFGLFIITVLYIASNYRLFLMMLFDGFSSGRQLKEIETGGQLNIKGFLGISFRETFTGQHHFHTMTFPFITVFTVITVILIKESRKIILIGMVLLFSISLLDNLSSWEVATPYFSKIDILSRVRFRWKSLSGLIWYIVFAKSCYYWYLSKYKKALVPLLSLNVLLIMFSVGDGFRYTEYTENSFHKTFFDTDNPDNSTFKEFYMIEQFKELKKIIPENTKVACFGIAPELAQYNNYNTFGGYSVLYSSEYKKLFNDVAGYDKPIAHPFYLLSDKPTTSLDNRIKRIKFSILKDEGYEYFLSRYPITSKKLTFITHIKGDLNRDIYLYKITMNK